MPTWTGSFNALGSPTLKVKIGGVLDPQELDAIIDTGFSGFILMPVVRAFPLGLILFGTTDVVLADGTRAHKYTAMGRAVVETETQPGIIILESGSTDVLVGIDFLRKFSKTLFVHQKNGFVVLIDDVDVEEFMKAVVKTLGEAAAAAAASPQPPPEPPADPAT